MQLAMIGLGRMAATWSSASCSTGTRSSRSIAIRRRDEVSEARRRAGEGSLRRRSAARDAARGLDHGPRRRAGRFDARRADARSSRGRHRDRRRQLEVHRFHGACRAAGDGGDPAHRLRDEPAGIWGLANGYCLMAAASARPSRTASRSSPRSRRRVVTRTSDQRGRVTT